MKGNMLLGLMALILFSALSVSLFFYTRMKNKEQIRISQSEESFYVGEMMAVQEYIVYQQDGSEKEPKVKRHSLLSTYAPERLHRKIELSSVANTFCGAVSFFTKDLVIGTCIEEIPGPDPCNPNIPGGLIDFEKLPDGTSTADVAEISDQYWQSHGVRFLLEGGGYPHLAKVGAPLTAHVCTGCPTAEDGLMPGEVLGVSFLTDNNKVNDKPARVLLVEYAAPVSKASGVLIDIDYGEAWTIEARDASGNTIVQKVLTFQGKEMTGRGAPFMINRRLMDIHSLRFSGTKPGNQVFGLAFDNFSPSGLCSYPSFDPCPTDSICHDLE